ncbi:MAG TPA: hypothetical protein VF285_12745 [Castellaniella sp.]|uniref:hypothetical protein n=1 Tax=Castellaniella sp. TaxID=1955812 RepID=UPI002EF31A87
MEALARSQRLYHQRAPWHGNGGLYIPHSYEEVADNDLSWWDDFQFILSGRRINTWWHHPRQAYQDELGSRSWDVVDPPDESSWLSVLEGKRHYKKVGCSRKRLVGREMRDKTADEQARSDATEAERQRLYAHGIDYTVIPSMKRERTSWSLFVGLCAPIEIRRPEDIQQAADLVRRLLRFEATLEREFPGYSYGKEDWLSKAPRRQAEEARHETAMGGGGPSLREPGPPVDNLPVST